MSIWEIATNYYQYFLRGTRTTILISLLTVFCGSILGCLIAFMRLSKFKPLEKFTSIYITVIRGTPMLVQLYIVYYQLDFISYPTGTLFDVDLERALPCIIALSINSSAYVAEIIRAGIQAVDKGQMEGARSCGMTNAQAMRYVVMPQAVKNILPAIGNEFVTMVKETSIIQYLGIGDLMYNNGIVVTSTYNPLPCYYISAIIYLALNIILGKGPSARSIRLDVPHFTLVGATTRSGQLTAPLRDRFGVLLRLELYTPEELAQIITRSAGILGIEIEKDGALEIASRSRGTPRIANRLLKRVRDIAQVEFQGDITEEVARAALARFEIDELGLDDFDRKMLTTIITNYSGGPVGLDTLAAAVGEEAVTIEDVYEPYLMQIGFLTRTARGRCVTALAYDHLGIRRSENAAQQSIF